MKHELQVMEARSPQAAGDALKGGRPRINKRIGATDRPVIYNARGPIGNSLLRRDEWVELDAAVMPAAVQPLNVARILMARNLSRPIRSIGQVAVQYPRRGEMTAATAHMRMHAADEKDLVDQDFATTPVPIISKMYEIDARVLESSRLLGEGLDTTNGAAAARVVAEKVEDMILNGDTAINLNGDTVYGLTTHPNRTTDTAANFGGGSWATITNPLLTIAGMISAAQAKGFYGPYGIISANAQFNQAAWYPFNDGSGDTPAQRIMRMGQGSMNQQILFLEPSAQLASGTIVLFQATSDVIELRYLDGMWPVTNVEWSTGDGSLYLFKVMTVMAPVIKAAYGGKSGIVVATGA